MEIKLESWRRRRLGRYLSLSLKAGAAPRKALVDLVQIADGNNVVVGIGQPTVLALGKTIATLKPFSTHFWRRAGFAVHFFGAMVLAAGTRSRRFTACVE